MLTGIAGDVLMFVAPCTSSTSLRLSQRVDSTPSPLALVHRQKTPGSLERQELRFVLFFIEIEHQKHSEHIHISVCVLYVESEHLRRLSAIKPPLSLHCLTVVIISNVVYIYCFRTIVTQ